MSEQLLVNKHASKKEKYESLIPQLKALLQSESDTIANMANTAAALKQTFNFYWVGFYTVKRDELFLGPFQGITACSRIKWGRGVCGTAWKEKRTVIVPNVNHFSEHIACDTAPLSEIVVPIFFRDEVIAVLDIDSMTENFFDETDAYFLELIADILKSVL